MAGMYDNQLLEILQQGAAGLLGEWGLAPQTKVELLTISENATFRAEEPEGESLRAFLFWANSGPFSFKAPDFR